MEIRDSPELATGQYPQPDESCPHPYACLGSQDPF